MFEINKFLPMTGFEPRTFGMKATALPTEPQPLPSFFVWERTKSVFRCKCATCVFCVRNSV